MPKLLPCRFTSAMGSRRSVRIGELAKLRRSQCSSPSIEFRSIMNPDCAYYESRGAPLEPLRDREGGVFKSLVLMVLLLLVKGSYAAAPPGLLEAVRSHLRLPADAKIPFRYALVDLNGDGRDDAVVFITAPKYCGSGGCVLEVFRGSAMGFGFLSGSTVTSLPIRVSTESTHGWRALIVQSKGRGDVVMRFDGTRYPLNPSVQPLATAVQVSAASTVIEK